MAHGEPGIREPEGWSVFIADRGTCIRIDRDIDRDLAKKLAISVENLNATVSPVSYIDSSLRINRDAVWSIDLTRLISGFTPRLEPVAILIDFGNSRIAIAVA